MASDWHAVIARIEEAAAIWRRVGDRLSLAFGLVWLGFAYGRAGRPREARSAAVEALELFREVDNPTGIVLAFVGLAFLATWEGRHEDALRLAGAPSRSGSAPAAARPAGFGGMLEGDPAADAREHLSEEAAGRAWEAGRAMSLEEALALARGGSSSG